MQCLIQVYHLNTCIYYISMTSKTLYKVPNFINCYLSLHVVIKTSLCVSTFRPILKICTVPPCQGLSTDYKMYYYNNLILYLLDVSVPIGSDLTQIFVYTFATSKKNFEILSHFFKTFCIMYSFRLPRPLHWRNIVHTYISNVSTYIQGMKLDNQICPVTRWQKAQTQWSIQYHMLCWDFKPLITDKGKQNINTTMT